jgi:uncharacterized protein with HEPN domain
VRQSRARLVDIVMAIKAIDDHMTRGDLRDGLVFDAVRVRLIEIGEAVKGIDVELLTTEAGIPWQDIASMRDHLAHRYFDTDHAIVASTIDRDLPMLLEAVGRLMRLIELES